MVFERQLTELEGAILTEIGMRGNDTAYKVRRAFQASPSVQWRGSAGAASPAIHRLVKAGLVVAEPHPTRKGQTLALSKAGLAALDHWAADVGLACGVGLDPFRLRSGVWERLPKNRRQRLFGALLRTLEDELAAITHGGGSGDSDVVHRRQDQLASILLEGRIRWLRARIAE